MSVKRGDLIKYFEENGFYFLREGKKHSGFVARSAAPGVKAAANDSCCPTKGIWSTLK